MRANKIFFDIFSTSGARMAKDEYKKWYDQNDTVYICLMDLGIYTKVKRQEMFDTGMHYGCLIENICSETPDQVMQAAMYWVNTHGLTFVSPEDFREAERSGEAKRVQKAFAYAEALIKQS